MYVSMYIKTALLIIYGHKQATVSLLVMLIKTEVIQAMFVTIDSVIQLFYNSKETARQM